MKKVFESGDKVTAITANHKVVHGIVGPRGTYADDAKTWRVEVRYTTRGHSYCFHPDLARVAERDQDLEDLLAAAEQLLQTEQEFAHGRLHDEKTSKLFDDLKLAVKTAKGE